MEWNKMRRCDCRLQEIATDLVQAKVVVFLVFHGVCKLRHCCYNVGVLTASCYVCILLWLTYVTLVAYVGFRLELKR